MPDDLGAEILRLQLLQQKIREGRVLEGVRRIISLLDQARREIAVDVMDSEWERFYLPRLRMAIEGHLEQWQGLALKELSGDMATNWNLGAAHVTGLFDTMEIQVRLPELPTSLLQTMQEKGARTLKGLANFAKDQIDRTIALSLIMGESREATIDKIGRHLEYGTLVGRPQGHFATLAARAKFIYEHEVSTAYADAKHRRFQQAAQYAPGLKKVWLHQGHPRVPRQDHIAMHGQARDPDDDFVNPVTGAELAFPRDPSASIKETANCTCSFVAWREEFGDKGTFIGQPQKKAVPAGTPQRSPHITREQDEYNPLGYVIPGQPVIKGGRP